MANTQAVTSVGWNSVFSETLAATSVLPAYVNSQSPSQSMQFTYGTGVGAINVLYWANITLAASASLTLELTNNASSLLDAFGAVLQTIARVKWMLFEFYNATIATVVYNSSEWVIGGGTNPFAGPYSGTFNVNTGPANTSGICAKAEFVRGDATGWPCVYGTNSNVKLTNSDSSNPGYCTVKIAGCNI